MGQQRKLRAEPSLEVDQRAIPLEPRVMLDANLTIDLAGTQDLTELMLGLAQSFDDQAQQADDLLESLESSGEAAMVLLDPLLDNTEDLSAVTDTVTRIQGALDELRSGLAGTVDDLFSDTFHDRLASSGSSSLGYTIDAAGLSTIFDSDSVLSGDLMSELVDYLGDQGATDAEADAEALLDLVVPSLDSSVSALSFTLTDIKVDGETLVSFSDGGNGSVTAEVTLLSEDFSADFTTLLADALPGLDLPFDLNAAGSVGNGFSFDISASIEVDAGTAALNALEVHVDNFDFDPLLTVGGALPLTGDLSATLGLLELGVDSIDTASFRLAVTGAEDLDLGGAIDFSGGLGSLDFEFYGTTTGADLSLDVLLAEAGSSDYAAIEEGTSYRMLDVGLTGTLDFSGATQTFGTDVTVSAVLADGNGGNILDTMLNSIDLGLDLDTSATVLSDELKQVFENLVNALATMSTGDLIDFLTDTGTALSGVLTDTMFDIEIPMTDISLTDAAEAIAAVFDDLVSAFVIDEGALGFDAQTIETLLTNEIVSFEADVLTDAQMDALAGYSTMTFAVQQGTDVTLNVTVDLTAAPELQDTSLSVAERMNALAALLNSSLLGTQYGMTFSVSSLGALKATTSQRTTDPDSGAETYTSFALTSVTETGGTLRDEVSLSALGFDGYALAALDYYVDAGDPDAAVMAGSGAASDGETSVQESFLGFQDAVTSFELNALDLDNLTGVTDLRFTFTVDGVDRKVDVSSDTGWTDLGDLIADFNAALTAEGIGVSVSANTDGDGLAFAIDAEEDRQVEVSVADGAILRATTLNGLLAWVNAELQDIWAGAMLDLTDDGALIFSLPEVTASAEITSDDEVYFTAEELGFGMLGDTNLSALLTASLSGTMTSSFGIGLADLGSDLIAAGGNALQGAAGQGDSVIDSVMDNAFLTDVSLELTVNAQASDITGTADLGIASIVVGGEDSSLNYVAFGAELYATLVGSNPDGSASSRISFNNLWNAVVNQVDLGDDGEVETTLATGLQGLIGRLDFGGTIVTDGEGLALDASGEAALSGSAVQFVSAHGYDGDDVLAQFSALLGDVSINVAGVNGLNEDVIDGLGVTVTDLTAIGATAEIAIIANDPDAEAALEGLAALEGDDILDSLVSIANMLVVVGDALEDNLPFLAADIPLLNFSLLDTISFSADFLEKLQEIRNDPQAALDELDGFLESFFGDDTVELTWDQEAATLVFGLSFEFLDDYSESLPFNIDLAELIGDQLADVVGEDLAATVTGLVDASGDGEIVFDPLLSLDFVFGLDLSALLAEPSTVASASTAISALATVGTVNMRPGGGAELRVTRVNAEGVLEKVDIDLDGAETIAEVVALVDTAVKGAFGDTVSFSYDEATGEVSLTDSLASATDDTGAEALTGAAETASEEVDGLQTIALSEISDFEAAYSFDLGVGEGRVTVEIDAVVGRTEEEFVAAVNAALAELSVARSDVFETGAPGTTVLVAQLVHAVGDGSGNVALVSTGFDTVLDYDTYDFTLLGVDISEEIEFALTDLGGANIAEALGLSGDGSYGAGTLTSEVLYEAVEDGSIRAYLDTEASGIHLSMFAGVTEGLNMTLALGPLQIAVDNGHAFIGAADGSGDPAYISFGFNDIDGDEHEGQYDLAHLFDIGEDPDLSYADLFDVDISIGIDVNLPLSDSIGLFDPATDGLTWTVSLVNLKDGASWSDLLNDGVSVSDVFEGALIDLASGNGLSEIYMPDIEFPDLSNFLDNINVLALLNDPVLVLDGLDMILDMMQSAIDDFLGAIDLPIVGEQIGAGVTFFDDFRINVLEAAMAYAETPLADGTMPTTVDLITGFLNDALNDLLGTSDTQYLHAYLNTDGSTDESYVYGALNFSAEIFNEVLDIGFDLGIPGFNLEMAEGAELQMSLGYSVNIGFGYDRNGFFLLNDTDESEMVIDFAVDAGDFTTTMELFGILGVTATTEADTSDPLYDSAASEHADDGELRLSAQLYVDLYGDQGLTITDPGQQGDGGAITSTIAYRDFGGIDITDSHGDPLSYEKVVYFSQLDTGNMIDFGFEARIDVMLSIQGDILDPSTGEPLLLGGVQFIPSVATELEFRAVYTLEDGLDMTALAFHDVRVDLSQLYEGILAPVLDPIRGFIDPAAEFFGFLDSTFPFNVIFNGLATAFPIVRMVQTIGQVITDLNDFLEDLEATGGVVVFGDYDFSGSTDDLESGEARLNTIDQKSISTDLTSTVSASQFGIFGNTTQGFAVEFPLLTDPFSVVDIFLGNYEDVGLVELHFTLFNLPYRQINLADELFDAIGLPGWVADIVQSAFKASVTLKLKGGLTVGYDLGGIVNFVETMDAERLLDGIYIESGIGSIIDVYFGFAVSLNLGIAGADLDGGAYFRLGLNDPNHDGKLRLPELIAVVESAADAGSLGGFLGTIFIGDGGVNLSLDVWVEIDLWLFSFGGSWTIINVNENIDFGGLPVLTSLSSDIGDTGGTAILNIGSRAGASMTDIYEDGDDSVYIDGPNSPYTLIYTQNGKRVESTIDQDAAAIILPAGSGNNRIDLSGVKPKSDGSTASTITYTREGDDEITLPSTGLHVVFAGDGNDTITAEDASGTYIIFGEEGQDSVNIDGGNVVYIGDDDYGMRDLFVTTFADGGVSEAKVLELLGLEYTAEGGLRASDGVSGDNLDLKVLMEGYTASTQRTAGSDADTITLGAGGTKIVMTGAGDDLIEIDSDNEGDVTILSGAGSDTISAGGDDIFIEGGADGDLIKVDGNTTEVWGWGKAAGESGTEGGDDIFALSLKDGQDIIIGGDGEDVLHGQMGDDILQGGLGNDTVTGGQGDDIATGGTFTLTTSGGSEIDLLTMTPGQSQTSGMILTVADAADGDDLLKGGNGSDILVGGGGEDTLEGGLSADLLVGDFARITMSASYVVTGVASTFITSVNNGTDSLAGGMGNDVLIAGGSTEGTIEVIEDLDGSNVVVGDFATITGAQILDAVTGMVSMASARGGADRITTGRGNDLIIGGEGDDTISAGLGADMVLGDLGTLSIADGELTGLANENDGDDIITFGADDAGHYGTAAPADLKDVAVGSLGDDSINSAAASLVAIGDAGNITLDPIALNALRTYVPLGANPTDAQRAQDTNALNLIAMLATQIETAGTVDDGNDTITSTGGDGMIALGGGSDVAHLADGVNYVLGDDGTITVEANGDYTGRKVVVTSADTAATSSDDEIITGAGDDVIVGGEGSDTISTGDGVNLVLGDSGEITGDTLDTEVPVYALTSHMDESDGDDSVTGGDDRDMVILGAGADWADLGDGVNLTLGDSGTIDETVGTGYDLLTTDAGTGGNDTVTGGEDRDIAILGDGSDEADLGDGRNIVLGDNGEIHVTEGVSFRALSTARGTGDDDTITTGAGDDVIIGGEGADSIAAGEADNLVLGDRGTITGDISDPAAPVYSLVSAYDDRDGDDTLTTGSAADALDLAILGGGNDLATMGDGTNIALGDSGTVDVTVGTGYDLLSTDPGTGGDDSVYGGAGADTVLLGDGSDDADLFDGANVALGDNGEIHFDIPEGTLDLWTTSPAIGGDDSITSGYDALFALAGVGADTVRAAGGTNWVMGDNGRMAFDTEGTVEMRTSDEDLGGNDVIETGSGEDVIIGGTGADTIDAGNGHNRGLGDSGSYVLDDTSGTQDGDLVSAYLDSDGADSLTSGAGNDFFILGGDADVADLGDGESRVIGDSGEIHWADTHLTELTTTDTNSGAGDTITSGAGADAILGGDGGDVIAAGSGDNAIIGDQGVLILDAGSLVNVVRDARTFDESEGGADSITSTAGDDVILGGALGDTIRSGAGEDAILGDNGRWISSHVTGEGSLTATLLDFGGDDVIDSGTGSDLVMGNLGDDDIYVDAGEDIVMGDDGTMTFINRSDVRTLVLTNEELGGDDTISAGDMSGDNLIVGQAGADSIMGGNTDDMIIADIAELTFTDPATRRAGQSAVDRIDYMIGTRMDLGFDDVVRAGGGNDFVMGGFGADTINGNDGQDFLIGETVIFQRSYEEMADGGLFEITLIDTNFAYETGGYDLISGDEGNDVMVGGLGGDLFFGNTAEDLIFSDAYAGEFHAEWSPLQFEGETAFRTLWQSNFAGPGAIDVVSRAQLDDAIGSPFDMLPAFSVAQFDMTERDLGGDFIAEGFGDEVQTLVFVNQLMDYLSSEKVVGALAVMVNSGAESSVLDDALRAGIAGQFAGVWNLDAPEFEMVIRQIIAFLLNRVQADNENEAPSEAA
ncbi:RTX-I toxin determinant A from serotypes 1/9 [Pseudooceanicola marinus]|uniref:RTX-I toxin determinant A from serotypes 1/9 n=2 Tax=Pseudooceanicola marinus TaxID=396013 RepID=A0A1X6Z4P8_9RHOB|nr:calcium-binding protein [Pseudooceanicola marinus]PJE32298.1 hypothetical protein CVM50_05105 [Pseudooceanicola marinus]SLN40049.1 RTX-I toxin determinant A from serotypes 1/9 [Pseudooceanicola marinus]